MHVRNWNYIMQREEAIKPIETAPVNIGRIIEDELRRQQRSVTWLSRKIHCDRRNIYDIFSREYIDTSLLWRISLALGRDFFVEYSRAMPE